MHVLQARDTKGLYAAARSGKTRNVVGLDIPFEKPEHSDLVINTSGDEPDIEKLAADVLARARSN